MVTRMGHIALRVPDLDAAVEFQHRVVGMVETERSNRVSYMTCNERHHELILIEDPVRRGYDHIALEVPGPDELLQTRDTALAAGGRVLGDVYDGEPGIERALRIIGPGGHAFKLFCGMERGVQLPAGDRPLKFEHASVKSRRPPVLERFLREGLGFRFSDRMGPFASWFHCDSDHHGMAIVWAPNEELSHYAYAVGDLSASGRTLDRLKLHTGRRAIWGPSRHGPGNNHFTYFHDHDGAMIEQCSELAQMEPGGYQPRNWPIGAATINQWGGRPPLRFLLAGFPIAGSDEPGRPAWAMAPGRTVVAAL